MGGGRSFIYLGQVWQRSFKPPQSLLTHLKKPPPRPWAMQPLLQPYCSPSAAQSGLNSRIDLPLERGPHLALDVEGSLTYSQSYSPYTKIYAPRPTLKGGGQLRARWEGIQGPVCIDGHSHTRVHMYIRGSIRAQGPPIYLFPANPSEHVCRGYPYKGPPKRPKYFS